MKKQDKIIKIDSFLRTNKTSFSWNLYEENEDVYYQAVLPTDIGTITIQLNIEDTPYTLISCDTDLVWKDTLQTEYFQFANDWMINSDILRVIVDVKEKRIIFSYTYTAMEDFFDPFSLISMADTLIQKVLETCFPKLKELDVS